jgi:tRNA 2-selenouridine synthase
LIVEAESKRIGKVTQPQELLDKKIGGLQIYIHASIASRVERIYREYVEPYYLEQWFYDQVKEKMSVIQKRIKDLTIRAAIIEELENRNYKQFIKLLLEYYYDPRYTHKLFEYGEEFIHINTDNQAEVINEIATIIDQSFSKLHP